MIGIAAKSSDVLIATLLSIKASPKSIQQNIRKYAKADIVPDWQQGLREVDSTPLQKALLVATGRASVTNNNIKLRSGGINAKVSGGLSTDTGAEGDSYKAAEFGANRFLAHTVKTVGGKVSRAKRLTQRQFQQYKKTGYVVYPTAIKLIPHIASLFVATTVRTLHDAYEGKLK